MLNINSTSISATSVIDGQIAAYYSASIPENGNPVITKSISNTKLYADNKLECEADFEAFENEAMKYVNAEE